MTALHKLTTPYRLRTLRRSLTLIVGLVALLALAWAPAAAQATPALAAVTSDGLVIVNGSTRLVVPGAPTAFANLRWSQDGDTLLYTRYEAAGPALYALPMSSLDPARIATTWYLPADFSLDGSAILYAAPSPDAQAADTLALTIYSQPLDLAATPDAIGQIAVGVGCGGGSPFPMDAVYNVEAGFGGRSLSFYATPGGVVYSLNCAGVGLGLLDTASGENRVLGGALSRAALADDGQRLLAFDEATGQIIVLSLTSGSRTALNPAQPVDQLAWLAADRIAYSSRVLLAEPLPLSEAEAEALGAAFGLPADAIPQYHVVVSQMTLDGTETTLADQPGWAIGRMARSNGALIFSLISNGESWVEALSTGAIDPLSPDSFSQAWQSVPVTLMQLTPGGEPVDLATGLYLFALNPSGG